MTNPDKPLTKKQQVFAMLVASGMSQADAYTKAYNTSGNPGTVRSEAGKVARKPAVAATIERLKAETAAELAKSMKHDLGLDRVFVLSNLKEVVERCMEHAPVRGRDGKPIPGQYTFDAKGANQALMLIGKELGMFVERREVRHGALVDASDEDIDREIATIANELAQLTGKPLRQVLLESVKMELAIDVTPQEVGALPKPGGDSEARDDAPGGVPSARGGAPELVYPRSRPGPDAAAPFRDVKQEVEG